jgi:RNA polymerase sigma-70 factor, ECF subfamily
VRLLEGGVEGGMLVSRDARTEIETVYREHGDRLWRALVGYTGDPEVASDAVVEAFAQALRRRDALDVPLRWIWRAAFRIAAGELAERRRRPVALREEPVLPAETDLDLVRALRRLSPKQRAAVLLHHYADYPVRQVAEIIGTSPGAVRVHLTMGRRRLRELLEDDHA